MNWQPIETAPKDGTLFLAFCPETEPFYDGVWSFRPKGPPGIAICRWDDYTCPQDHMWRPLGWVLAHIWMPLPEAPQ